MKRTHDVIHIVAVAAYIGLIVLTLLWEGWLAPAPQLPPGFWLMIKALPLLLPLFGLLHGKTFTFGWAAMLVLVYMLEALVLVVSHRREAWDWHAVLPYAWAELALTLVFFVSAMMFIRRRARAPL